MPQKRRRVFILHTKNSSKIAIQQIKNSVNLNTENIFNKTFPVLQINVVESIDLNSYNDIVDISNNYRDGKFLESGVMIDGKVIQANITPIEEKKIYSS